MPTTVKKTKQGLKIITETTTHHEFRIIQENKNLHKQITKGIFFGVIAIFLLVAGTARLAEGDYIWGILDFALLFALLFI